MEMNSGSASSPAVDELCQLSTHMLSILYVDSTGPFIPFPLCLLKPPAHPPELLY